jgi:uncharacterized protein (TIGR02597 family)
MKSTQFALSAKLPGVLAASLLLAHAGYGQTTAATAPVGFVSTPVLANSDTLMTIPFARPAVFAGGIGSISGNTITVASSPAWTANQFVYAQGVQSNTYYAIVGPNPATVTGTVSVTNGSTAVTGSGTAFTSQIAVNDELVVNGLAYSVSAVPSSTSLTLARAYAGSSAAAVSATYDHSPKEGSWYTVTANGTNTLTVNLNGDSLGAVAAGTTISLVPFWTLGTAFPASAAGTSYIDSTTPKSPQTLVLMPDLTSEGINLAASASYFHYNGSWRLSGADPTVVYDDTVLPPSNYFTVRNSATATTFTPCGAVSINRLTIPLNTQPSTQQDNAVAVARPIGVDLNDTDLVSSGAFVASTSIKSPADLLLTYDNTVVGENKSAAAIYFYYNGAWRQAGADSTVDYGSTVIPAGSALTIRKAANNTGLTGFWQNTPNY